MAQLNVKEFFFHHNLKKNLLTLTINTIAVTLNKTTIENPSGYKQKEWSQFKNLTASHIHEPNSQN